MSCCDPEFRQLALEKEVEVNAKGKERIPWWTKGLLSIMTILGILLAYILS